MSTLASNILPCFSVITVSILGVNIRQGLHHLQSTMQYMIQVCCKLNFLILIFEGNREFESNAYVAKKSTITGTLEFFTRSSKSFMSCTLKVTETTCSCTCAVVYDLLRKILRTTRTPTRCISLLAC